MLLFSAKLLYYIPLIFICISYLVFLPRGQWPSLCRVSVAGGCPLSVVHSPLSVVLAAVVNFPFGQDFEFGH